MIIGQSRCAVETSDANAAPVAADDAYTATAGTPLVVPAGGVVANDTDTDGDALRASPLAPTPPPSSGGGTWAFPGSPAHGTVSLGADGSFTYVPAAGYVGDDGFSYLSQDRRGATDTAQVAVTVVPAPQNTVSVGDVAVSEGDSASRAAVFTVSLRQPSASAVSVDYATANGSAGAGDYTAKAGTLSFAAGVTSMTVKVPVTGDTLDEADESFAVVLSNPTGVAMGDATGTGGIVDDDPKSVTGPRLAVGDVRVHEGNSGPRSAVFTVSLSKASTSTVKVSYATANASATKGLDYTKASGTVSFAAGVTSVTVKVALAADTVVEGNETFALTLSAASGAAITDGTGVGTILDDD